MPSRSVVLVSCLALLACGCEEDPPLKGAASRGSSPLFADGGAPVPTKRIVLDPGGPLAASRVADVARKRLLALGLSPQAVKIGAHTVNVDVEEKRLAETTKALDGGRFDMYVFDESQEPFRDSKDLGDVVVKEEVVFAEAGAARTVTYVVGDRAAIDKLVAAQETPSLGLVGPVEVDGKKRYRSYFVERERDTRGEYIAAAEALEENGSAYLVLTLDGGAVNMLRWSSRRKRRLVAFINGDVVATAQPDSLIKDGVIRFEVDTLEAATSLAKSLNTTAFSHKVTRVDKP